MKITLPKGYAPPENTRPGESFEAVATLTVGEDGSFELTAIDGNDLGGGEAVVAEGEVPPEAMNELEQFATKIPLPWDQP